VDQNVVADLAGVARVYFSSDATVEVTAFEPRSGRVANPQVLSLGIESAAPVLELILTEPPSTGRSDLHVHVFGVGPERPPIPFAILVESQVPEEPVRRIHSSEPPGTVVVENLPYGPVTVTLIDRLKPPICPYEESLGFSRLHVIAQGIRNEVTFEVPIHPTMSVAIERELPERARLRSFKEDHDPEDLPITLFREGGGYQKRTDVVAPGVYFLRLSSAGPQRIEVFGAVSGTLLWSQDVSLRTGSLEELVLK